MLASNTRGLMLASFNTPPRPDVKFHVSRRQGVVGPEEMDDGGLDRSRRRHRVAGRPLSRAGTARSRAGDLIGHEVNVAARIAERALGGEILVSDAVRGAADGLAARFRPVRALVIAGREPRPLFRAQATTMSAACQTASKARCTET